jgi:hypothetical protein
VDWNEIILQCHLACLLALKRWWHRWKATVPRLLGHQTPSCLPLTCFSDLGCIFLCQLTSSHNPSEAWLLFPHRHRLQSMSWDTEVWRQSLLSVCDTVENNSKSGYVRVLINIKSCKYWQHTSHQSSLLKMEWVSTSLHRHHFGIF